MLHPIVCDCVCLLGDAATTATRASISTVLLHTPRMPANPILFIYPPSPLPVFTLLLPLAQTKLLSFAVSGGTAEVDEIIAQAGLRAAGSE